MAYFENKKFDPLFVMRSTLPVGSDARRHVENKMATMIIAMVKNYARHPFFCQYPDYFKDDLVAEGYNAIWVKLDGFDRTQGTNYFAYFTSVSKNAFLALLRDYYKKKNKNIPMGVMENFLTEVEC